MSAPITYPLTEEGVSQALVALGTTASAVATNLTAMGFKGKQDDPKCCPVARYLCASVDALDAVEVSWTIIAAIDGVVIDVPRPPPVNDFVGAFDMGEYRDLIEETPDA